MEKILYPSIALTITELCISLCESQHAIAIVTNADPASLPIKIELEFSSDVPNNMETSIEGTIASVNPVAPSTSAVTVSNDFILFEIYPFCFQALFSYPIFIFSTC